jgi:hypothetical protein
MSRTPGMDECRQSASKSFSEACLPIQALGSNDTAPTRKQNCGANEAGPHLAKYSSAVSAGFGSLSVSSSSTPPRSSAQECNSGATSPNGVSARVQDSGVSQSRTRAWLWKSQGYEHGKRTEQGNADLDNLFARQQDVGLDANEGTSVVRRAVASQEGLPAVKGRKLEELAGIGSWVDDTAGDESD